MSRKFRKRERIIPRALRSLFLVLVELEEGLGGRGWREEKMKEGEIWEQKVERGKLKVVKL